MVEAQPIAENTPSSRKKRSGIALCLSGGGFRASLFHLGALRRLHELGILSRIQTISAVSGGSIFAAFLASRIVENPKGIEFNDWEKDVAAPFRKFVSRDIRTIPVLMHVMWNWAFPNLRVRHLERLYRKHLTSLKLKDLPVQPNFIFCATDLAFGVNWEFRREESGDFQAGYLASAADWFVARAVAASSSFPPIFGPALVRAPYREFKRGNYRGEDREQLLSKLSLSDGGVYDNMGHEPVLKTHEFILVSDCGAPFALGLKWSPLRRLLRYTSVLMNQVQALRKRLLFAGKTYKTHKVAYWGIASAIRESCQENESAFFGGYSESLVNEVIARIRTDLDAFTKWEIGILENHGYYSADRAIRRHLPELLDDISSPPVAPYPDLTDEAVVRKALKHSHKQFSLRRMLTSLLSLRI